MLEAELDDGAIPAIADDKSVTWAMHKTIGDSLDYTDEQGNAFKVVLVGTLANSILQGNLLIDEDRRTAPSLQGSDRRDPGPRRWVGCAARRFR